MGGAKAYHPTVVGKSVGGWVVVGSYSALTLQSLLTSRTTHTSNSGLFQCRNHPETQGDADRETSGLQNGFQQTGG